MGWQDDPVISEAQALKLFPPSGDISTYTPGKGDPKMEGGWKTTSGEPMTTLERAQSGHDPHMTLAVKPGDPRYGTSGVFITKSGKKIPAKVTDTGPGVKDIDVASSNPALAKSTPSEIADGQYIPGANPQVGSWQNDPIVPSPTPSHSVTDYLRANVEEPSDEDEPIIGRSGTQVEDLEARQFLTTSPEQFRGTGDQPMFEIPKIPQQEGLIPQIAAGSMNTLGGIAQTIETPQMIAALPVLGTRPVAAAYSIQSLRDIPSAYREFTAPDKSVQERTEAFGRGAMDITFGTLLGLGALKPRGAGRVPSKATPDVSEIPQVNSPPLEGTAWYDQNGDLVNVGEETETPLATAKEPVVEAQTGVANRYLAEAIQRGELPPDITHLNGISYEDTIKIGNKLRKSPTNPKGANPYEIARKVRASGTLSPSDWFVLRAEYHDLAQQAKILADVSARNPLDPVARNAMENARKAQVDFLNNAIALGKNIWHKIGMGMQSEAPVDYATFEGQREAFVNALKREPNKHEKATLRRGAERVRKAKDADAGSRQEIRKAIDKELGRADRSYLHRIQSEMEKMVRELTPCRK